MVLLLHHSAQWKWETEWKQGKTHRTTTKKQPTLIQFKYLHSQFNMFSSVCIFFLFSLNQIKWHFSKRIDHGNKQPIAVIQFGIVFVFQSEFYGHFQAFIPHSDASLFLPPNFGKKSLLFNVVASFLSLYSFPCILPNWMEKRRINDSITLSETILKICRHKAANGNLVLFAHRQKCTR